MLPKKGTLLPDERKFQSYPPAIAQALKEELGTSHRAIKTIMRWTGASERTVKNWLSGNSGPNGQYLIDLARHSDTVLETLLILADRHQMVAMQKLFEARNRLAETVADIDELIRQ